MKSKTLLPVEQALVSFHNEEILAVRLSDGRIAASLRSLCNMLKLARHGQMERIRADAVLSKELLLVIIKTPGGQQTAEVLTAKAIPTWLTGLQPNMVAPEKRPLITALKEEAMEVLYRHFFKIDADEKAAPPPPKTEQPEEPRRSAFGLMREGVRLLEAGIEALEDEHKASAEHRIIVDETQMAMGEHIVALEAEMKRLKPEPASKATPKPRQPVPQDGPILTTEHRNQVYALARHQRDQTGEPVAAQLADLAETFGVEDISDIPDAAWEEVAAWLWQRR